MPRFGRQSAIRLETCHEDLIRVFEEVVIVHDCSILCGRRTKEDQDKAFSSGNSKTEFPDSTHNADPSNGVDVSPYPIPDRWGDIDPVAEFAQIEHQMKEWHKFYALAGVVYGVAHVLGIGIRWGGDWDGDKDYNDQTFDDLVHYERLGR